MASEFSWIKDKNSIKGKDFSLCEKFVTQIASHAKGVTPVDDTATDSHVREKIAQISGCVNSLAGSTFLAFLPQKVLGDLKTAYQVDNSDCMSMARFFQALLHSMRSTILVLKTILEERALVYSIGTENKSETGPNEDEEAKTAATENKSAASHEEEE